MEGKSREQEKGKLEVWIMFRGTNEEDEAAAAAALIIPFQSQS